MSTEAGIDTVLGHIRNEVDEGLFSTGAQVFVWHDGAVVVDEAYGNDGFGAPMTTDTLHRIHCAGKPLAALAIATLVDDDELSFHDVLADVIDDLDNPAIGGLTIDDLLAHRGGLTQMAAANMEFLAPTVRTALVRAVQPEHRSEAVAYSEYAAWHLLGLAISDLTGAPAADAIRDRVLAPFGLADQLFIGFSPAERERHGHRLVPGLDMAEFEPLPLLFGIAEPVVAARELPNGTLGSMSGLGRFYVELLDILDGRATGPIAPETVRHLVEPSGPTAWEPLMQRECRYGHGFMVDLAEHKFSQYASPTSFGHSGYKGVTAAFADPEHRLVVALHYNGLVDVASSLDFRRQSRFDALYRALVAPPARVAV